MSDALARPTFQPFDLDAEYVWLECDLPHYTEFRCEVRMNLRNKDRKRLAIAIDEINEERTNIGENSRRRSIEIQERRDNAKQSGDVNAQNAAIEAHFAFLEETAKAYDGNSERMHVLIAPYVRRWNLVDRDDSGELIEAPPPMEIGPQAFEVMDQKLLTWLVNQILGAYKGGNGFSGSLLTASESVAPSNESNVTTETAEPPVNRPENDQPSRKNSRSRSRSTLPISDLGNTGRPIQPSST